MSLMKKIMYYVVSSCLFCNVIAQDKELIEIIKQDKEAIKITLNMIDDIIKEIQQFLIIIQSFPEMPKKIEQWGQSKVITNWPEKSDWSSFSKDLQIFMKELVVAKEQEIQTKEYKYLAYIIEKADLSDKLIALQNDLNQSVPTIVVAEIKQGIKAESKKALRDAINSLATILYSDSVLSQLDEIFKTYEPVAEKLKTEAQAAEEKALEVEDTSY